MEVTWVGLAVTVLTPMVRTATRPKTFFMVNCMMSSIGEDS